MPILKYEGNSREEQCIESEKYPRAILWLTILLFLTASSFMFASFFEYSRYLELVDPAGDKTNFLDRLLLFVGILAKSQLLIAPLMAIAGCLILLGLCKTGIAIVILWWGMTFLFMTADLVATSFRGVHIWDYLPSRTDIGDNALAWSWRMVGERIKAEALIVLALCALAAPTLFFAAKRLTERLVRWRPSLVSKKFLIVFTAALGFLSLGILTVPPCFRETIYASMPIPSPVRESLESCAESLEDLALRDKRSCSSVLTIPGNEGQAQAVSFTDELYVARMIRNGLEARPPDPSAFVSGSGLPNVILVVVESLRYDALNTNLMKALNEWSDQGLRLERHYSGSNVTQLGFFSLLYSRVPVAYDRTLDNQIPSQMSESLRNSGYADTCLTDELTPFLRMTDLLSPLSCDINIEEGRFTFNARDVRHWPDADRKKIARALHIVKKASDRPQFVLLYLLSSHHRYYFPPEFEILKETHTLWKYLDSPTQIQNHRNRYANSLSFLDHELINFVKSVDLERNIVIITGDHGQSMREDGVFTHGSRRSEIQIRVPLMMMGPGVPHRKISTATVHYDVLPTLLHALSGREIPIMNSDGRDLLADQDPPDKVLVLPVHLQVLEPLLIRGQDRILFKLVNRDTERPELRFGGLVDELGGYRHRPSSSERRRRALHLEASAP